MRDNWSMNTDPNGEAVLDTNVLVSAALSDGNPADVLSMADAGEIISVTSPAIIEELRDVLTRDRLPFSDEQVAELAVKVLSLSRVIEPDVECEVIDDDPDDDKILECAIAGDVDYVVSGDSHLLDLGGHAGVEIVSPAAFLREFDG